MQEKNAIIPMHRKIENNFIIYRNDIRLPRLRRAPCEQFHPQSRYGTDQVSGFTLFCTFTLPHPHAGQTKKPVSDTEDGLCNHA